MLSVTLSTNAPRPLLFTALVVRSGLPLKAGEPPGVFNRDIRPILSENCYYCHGQDATQRKAHLRLYTVEGRGG